MEKKLSKPQVAESPIADVLENRNPSEAEKNWAEKTLAPTIEKSPERPIGSPTGTNLDENGNARFTTISGMPIRRLYTEADLPPTGAKKNILDIPANRLSRAAFTQRDIAASFIPCANFPASPRRKKPIAVTNIYWNMEAAASRSHSICPP